MSDRGGCEGKSLIAFNPDRGLYYLEWGFKTVFCLLLIILPVKQMHMFMYHSVTLIIHQMEHTHMRCYIICMYNLCCNQEILQNAFYLYMAVMVFFLSADAKL